MTMKCKKIWGLIFGVVATLIVGLLLWSPPCIDGWSPRTLFIVDAITIVLFVFSLMLLLSDKVILPLLIALIPLGLTLIAILFALEPNGLNWSKTIIYMILWILLINMFSGIAADILGNLADSGKGNKINTLSADTINTATKIGIRAAVGFFLLVLLVKFPDVATLIATDLKDLVKLV